MKPCICIHGHFYQPPRENPWLDAVESQDSASPWHDWNERITAECYAPNAAARILGEDGKIIAIRKNYARMSFNMGPTLLTWMERAKPDVYGAIIDADAEGAERFSGHGPAIAQAYGHAILPLAPERDRRTQIVWGIRDFERRFGRFPEGMWLPETAADTPTLEALAAEGIRFTILAPRQASEVRLASSDGSERWTDVGGERIERGVPYICSLPSGKSLVLFFYDGPLSRDIAFGPLLRNGGELAQRLIEAGRSLWTDGAAEAALEIVALDGETFGHHHTYGDMALAYCLDLVETGRDATLTVFGEYLDRFPPKREVRIVENSSWSCAHGVERWRADCGCCTGMHPGWRQTWRGPLRQGLDFLGESLDGLFETGGRELFADPWTVRNAYVDIADIQQYRDDVRADSVDRFLEKHIGRKPTPEERTRALTLLEMQRCRLLMFTSCGWFFDDISGIESIQILRYAARAMDLAETLSPEFRLRDIAGGFLRELEKAPSNIPELLDGARIFNVFVEPERAEPLRVGANIAVSSFFPVRNGTLPGNDRPPDIPAFRPEIRKRETGGTEGKTYGIGLISILDIRLQARYDVCYAILSRGGKDLVCGAGYCGTDEEYERNRSKLLPSLLSGDERGIVRMFGHDTFSLRHLFRDELRRITRRIIADDAHDIERILRDVVRNYEGLLEFLSVVSVPVPEAVRSAAEVICNADIRLEIERPVPNTERLLRLCRNARKWRVEIDVPGLTHILVGRMDEFAAMFDQPGREEDAVEMIGRMAAFVRSAGWPVNLWNVQNAFFRFIGRHPKTKETEDLAGLLDIRIE
jgi:alpha-amylase/alpha-mannosidase (GH57 family)